ncbi:hypothetical protein IQ264_07605 [Phormidium sp. LEGE 05292]|uniref:hypothetical protein n=1 Tax=[Phormidium] sp. LEGE 05292 TaxID=767427 RepID=UPI00187E7836|nr:hypothetical protein [Phormidium sp. LEGE 05292]MBE9225297.1 hypothetical protein [Phormidium sp. LEGE 05292]
MRRLSISYDLRNRNRDYQKLHSILSQLGAKRSLLSKWELRCNYSAAELLDKLKRYIDTDDCVVVDEIVDSVSFNAKTDSYWEGFGEVQPNFVKKFY